MLRARALVEFGEMTWPEVRNALAAGKTTALYYTGGTEHRGPQNINGGHNYMARATVKAIALSWATPSPCRCCRTRLTSQRYAAGTIGLTNEILASILERLAEQAIASGFKTWC